MKIETNFQRTLKKLFKRKLAVVGLAICLCILFITIFATWLSPYSASDTVVRDRFQGISVQHIFGCDELGRDVFSRILNGAQITFAVAVGSVGIALVCGTFLGLFSGFFGGFLDAIISGFMDALWAFPAIILALAINAALGASLENIYIAIGVVYIPDFCRIVRSRVLSIREMEYIMGAQAIGLSDSQIIFRYVIPNLSSTLIVQTTLCCAKAVIAEASLSFLGLGVPLPMASWGSMLKSGYPLLDRAPWLSIFPGLFIMLFVLGLNFLGDGLRDALDVRIRAD
ncbi:MAG: ABC transporter permease [Negativicutes bacterium]